MFTCIYGGPGLCPVGLSPLSFSFRKRIPALSLPRRQHTFCLQKIYKHFNNRRNQITTKEKILDISLELFSKQGFSGVSVRDIAQEVGVRESALYKHFKNKRDIFDSIIIMMSEKIRNAYIENSVPELISKDYAQAYAKLSTDKLCEISWNLFCLFTKDPMVSRYRKLLTLEQYNNSDVSSQYDKSFISGVIKSQSIIFKKLVNSGIFIEEDEEIIALEFYGPIQLLFQAYDCNPNNEKAIKEILFKHVKSFGSRYSKNNKNSRIRKVTK